MLKVYVRHVMVVDKIHEKISFKQSNWLQNFINFIAQKRIQANKDMKKTSINYITHSREKQ